MKPIIGVTACTLNSILPKLEKGNSDQRAEYKKLVDESASIRAIYSFNHSVQLVFENDLRAIEAAGGIPLIIPASDKLENLEAILNVVSGILITGGYDVDPKHYNEEDQYSKGLLGDLATLSDEDAGFFAKFSERRDEMEIALVQKAYDKSIPVLGICRGNQVINVAMGGSVYQDIIMQEASEHEHTDIDKWNDISHKIVIEKDSRLYKIIKKEQFGINSIHHQAVKAVGHNLKAVARAEDGIIECIEAIDDRFIMGVQWHPEMLAHDDAQQSIFKYFIECCRIE